MLSLPADTRRCGEVVQGGREVTRYLVSDSIASAILGDVLKDAFEFRAGKR